MQPKFVVLTLIILNLVFLAVLLLATQSSLFDLWLTRKILPHVCVEQTETAGVERLTFCK